MKTPEEMAKEWYWANLTEESPVVMLTNPVKHPPCPRKAFLAGYQAAQPQWISVKDRLPEIGHRILVTHRRSEDYANLHVLEARRISDDEYCLPEDYSILAHYVDYWMPLPKPPKEI